MTDPDPHLFILTGWTAGADATVAVGKIGANGSVDTETMKQAVSSFILTNVGLEAGARWAPPR